MVKIDLNAFFFAFLNLETNMEFLPWEKKKSKSVNFTTEKKIKVIS